MTISVQTPFNEYTANGIATSYAFSFRADSEDHLVVLFDNVVQDSGFTVSGIGEGSGGAILFSVAPTSGVNVQIRRDVTLERTTDLTEGAAIPSTTLDTDIDQVWMALQDFNSTTIRLGTDGKWDAGSHVIKNVANPVNPTDAMNYQSSLSSISAAAASAAAALVSENNAETAETNAAASAAAALVSENNAGASETAAAASELAAGNSETAAAASAAAALVSENNAETAETNAAASALAASNSETAAAASAAAALVSEGNADDSAIAAAASAAAALVSEGNASDSEIAAALSETNALASEVAAAASAATIPALTGAPDALKGIRANGAGTAYELYVGGGDIFGPASAVDEGFAIFDGTTGKIVKDHGAVVTIAKGGSGRSSHTEYAVICGGTTTTGAQQSVASVGTAGQALLSNGAGALPTFQTLDLSAATNLKWLGASYTVSTSAPSGGTDGDFWFEREA